MKRPLLLLPLLALALLASSCGTTLHVRTAAGDPVQGAFVSRWYGAGGCLCLYPAGIGGFRGRMTDEAGEAWIPPVLTVMSSTDYIVVSPDLTGYALVDKSNPQVPALEEFLPLDAGHRTLFSLLTGTPEPDFCFGAVGDPPMGYTTAFWFGDGGWDFLKRWRELRAAAQRPKPHAESAEPEPHAESEEGAE